jgi:hypothetical protein
MFSLLGDILLLSLVKNEKQWNLRVRWDAAEFSCESRSR